MKPNGNFRILNKKIQLQISYDDLCAIRHIVGIAPKEAQWFHRLERVESDDKLCTAYRIYDMFIPEQYCSGAEVESDPNMMVKFYRELVDKHGAEESNEILQNLTVWCHSHHNMGVSPSGQDNKQFLEFVENGRDSKVSLPQIMLIFNKQDMFYSKIWDPVSGVLCENVPILIESKDFDYIDAQAKVKFKKKPVAKKSGKKPTATQGYLNWETGWEGLGSRGSAASGYGYSASRDSHNKKNQSRPRDNISAISDVPQKGIEERALRSRDEITELAELIHVTNSCHTEVERLITYLNGHSSTEEFCVFELLLNGTEGEILELKTCFIAYDDDDRLSSQLELYELFVDSVIPPGIIAVAYEVAIAVADSSCSSDRAEQLVDFWLDAYASAFSGETIETQQALF